MSIQILFFGVTAAITGRRNISIESSETSSVEVFEKMLAEHPGLRNHKLHFSVNQQYATGHEVIRDGDELAIFTAVSGG